MRILVLTQVLPYPLDAGPKVRAYHVLQYLATQHEIVLVSFARDGDSPAALAHLRTICREVAVVPMTRSRRGELAGLWRSVRSGEPFLIARDHRNSMHDLLAAMVAREDFDAIHADQLSMAAYGLSAAAALAARHGGRRPRLIIDVHNAYYLIPDRMAETTRNPLMRAFLRREARLTQRYERRVYQQFDVALTVTVEDLNAIRRIMPAESAKPHWLTIPICVDASQPPLPRSSKPRGALMLGGLHWPPNADAVRWLHEAIWPRVRTQVPDARLFVVGARPPDDIRALGDFPGVQSPEDAGAAPVVVAGYVSDPSPFLRESAVLVVALRSGGGMRVKIVEAMLWGIPIVTTSIGCEGIDVVHGKHVLIADDPTQFADLIARVLSEPDLAARLAEESRRLVEERYSWQTAYRQLDTVYAKSV